MLTPSLQAPVTNLSSVTAVSDVHTIFVPEKEIKNACSSPEVLFAEVLFAQPVLVAAALMSVSVRIVSLRIAIASIKQATLFAPNRAIQAPLSLRHPAAALAVPAAVHVRETITSAQCPLSSRNSFCMMSLARVLWLQVSLQRQISRCTTCRQRAFTSLFHRLTSPPHRSLTM